MMGAIIGDIVGSRFEHRNMQLKTKDFRFLDEGCYFTDDTVCTLAIAKAIMECNGNVDLLGDQTIKCLQEVGRPYPHCGWGGHFRHWIYGDDPQPYNSLGNGAPMRVSAVAWAAQTLDECVHMSKAVTEVSHNHPEGIKGAEAIAVATYMALHDSSKNEIRAKMQEYYNLDFTTDAIRPFYQFDVTCMGTVPPAIVAFLDSTDYVDAIRNAVSIGGDSDTIAACTGAIAEAYYGIPQMTRDFAETYLDERLDRILMEFERAFPSKIA